VHREVGGLLIAHAAHARRTPGTLGTRPRRTLGTRVAARGAPARAL
jgi:hypothetical protein